MPQYCWLCLAAIGMYCLLIWSIGQWVQAHAPSGHEDKNGWHKDK